MLLPGSGSARSFGYFAGFRARWVASVLFSDAEAKNHKYPGQEGARSEIEIVHHLEGFEAPLVGIIQNRFHKAKDINAFLGKEEKGVKLEPIVGDILGEVFRASFKEITTQLDEFNAAVKGLKLNAQLPCHQQEPNSFI